MQINRELNVRLARDGRESLIGLAAGRLSGSTLEHLTALDLTLHWRDSLLVKGDQR